MDRESLLADLCAEARPRILAEFHPDSCLVSTAVAIDVLAYFGVSAVPVECQTMAANRLAADALRAGLEPDWHAGAWTVGIVTAAEVDGRRTKPGAWEGGHLVAVTDDGWLVDLSADQMDRPAKSIDVTAFAAYVGDWTGPVSFGTPGGAELRYERVDGPRSWRRSPDWQDRSRRRRIVGDTIRALRARQEVS